MTEEERFKKMKREISGSVNAFKNEMDEIIGLDDSGISSSDDDNDANQAVLAIESAISVQREQKEAGKLSQPNSVKG